MDLLYDYKHYSAHAFPPSPAVSGAKQISRSIFFPPQMSRKIQFEYRVFFNPLVEMNKVTLWMSTKMSPGNLQEGNVTVAGVAI